MPDLLAENEELRNWANDERKLADELADVLLNWGDAGYEFEAERSRVLARYREARGR